ncbi:DUF6268 family outer membrane beta-barrel protein [Treponema ruminis]|uniref:Tetratricopeptide (TPR) repeat protein n=1 Tax=Treponema ruminis TaxID=744515 RepID=A0A7W8G865_9SPIR|nr:DUF6268 family outer membrane beta-barrel protein [Treponema ruminis]MBB5225638.1 tetratricopeptide (TPR) repeat protein [Treponema ruminis]
MAAAFLPLAATFADGDVILNVHGYLGGVFSSNYDAFPVTSTYGGGVKLAYRTPTILEISTGFDYLILPRETKTDETLSSASAMRANVGLGFYIPIFERFSILPFVNAGVYSLSVSDTTKNSLFFGGGISFAYKINPHLSFEAPLMVEFNRGVFSDVGAAPGITLNVSKMIRRDTLISMQVKEVKPVFPVLHSWYEKNPFATVEIKNEEECGITDVSVSFFQGQYMGQPQLCATRKRVEKQESFDVDLVAFFNEQMLDLIEKVDSLGSVIVEYRVLGQKKRKTFPITLGIYGRNSMSWDDDRRAAVFVSSKDPAAMLFSRHVTSSVRNNLRSGVPLNIQYAMGIFEALDEFGINYVIDPNSSYSDNVGSTSIDFLQFPYQTLMYRGGDCDDLSILTCSLFESVGVHTAFITIPGHIFIAFDSGVKQKDAWRYFNSLDEYILSDGEVWVPLEITLSDEGYTKAWRVGAREWHVAARTNEAMLYKMRDSWELYKPVGVSGAQAKFLLPEKKQLLSRFSNSVDHWITREIDPQIRSFKNMLAKKEDPGVRNDFGILYVRYGLFDEAEKQFRIARKSNNKNALLNTASMYYAKEQYENAAYMYRQVINNDPKNILAYLGLARCAYEVGDYETCDDAYEMVRENDMELAMDYAYLGSFETVRGRAFSLSERLEKTIWVGSNSFMNGQYEILDKSMYEEPKIGLSNPYIQSTHMEYKIPEIEKTIVKKYDESDEDAFTGSMYDAVAEQKTALETSGESPAPATVAQAEGQKPAEKTAGKTGKTSKTQAKKTASKTGKTSAKTGSPADGALSAVASTTGGAATGGAAVAGGAAGGAAGAGKGIVGGGISGITAAIRALGGSKETKESKENGQIVNSDENTTLAENTAISQENLGEQNEQFVEADESEEVAESPYQIEGVSAPVADISEGTDSSNQIARAEPHESQTVSESIAETTSVVVETVSKKAEQVAEAVSKTTEAVVESVSKTTEAVVESVSKTTEAVVESVSKTTEAVAEQVTKTKEAVAEQVEKTTEAVVEFVTPIVDSITEIVDPEGTAKRVEARKEAAAKKEEEKLAKKAEKKAQEEKKAQARTASESRTASKSYPENERLSESESIPESQNSAEEYIYIEENSPSADYSLTETADTPVYSDSSVYDDSPAESDTPVAENADTESESGSVTERAERAERALSRTSGKKDMAIRFSDGHTWQRVAVNKAENKPKKSKKSSAKITKKKSLRDYISFRQGKAKKGKYPYEAPRESRNISLIQAVYEDDLKKKRFYVPLGRFNNFRDAYLFWLAHPEYPAVIVRVGYSEFEVRAGDYSEKEYNFLKSLLNNL